MERRSKRIPTDVEIGVLMRARRRCCVCYALYRTTALKVGQIARLNADPSDNGVDNLAFLCADHHAEYVSPARRTTGLTTADVKHARSRLDHLMTSLDPARVSDAGPGTGAQPAIQGRYVRLPRYDSAEISVAALPGGHGEFHVTGLALRGLSRASPRMGILDFIASLRSDQLEYHDAASGEVFSITVRFQSDRLVVDEHGSNPSAAPNVPFRGVYGRA